MKTKTGKIGMGVFWVETRHGKHPDDFTVDRAESSDNPKHTEYAEFMLSIRLTVSCCFYLSVSSHKRSRRAALDVNIGQLTPWRHAHKQKYGPWSTWVLHYIILWHIHKQQSLVLIRIGNKTEVVNTIFLFRCAILKVVVFICLLYGHMFILPYI